MNWIHKKTGNEYELIKIYSIKLPIIGWIDIIKYRPIRSNDEYFRFSWDFYKNFTRV